MKILIFFIYHLITDKQADSAIPRKEQIRKMHDMARMPSSLRKQDEPTPREDKATPDKKPISKSKPIKINF